MARNEDSTPLEFFLFAVAVAASAAVFAAAVDRASVSQSDGANAALIGRPRTALVQPLRDQGITTPDADKSRPDLPAAPKP